MFDEIVGLGVLDDGGDTEDFGGGEGGGAEGVVDGAGTILHQSIIRIVCSFVIKELITLS